MHITNYSLCKCLFKAQEGETKWNLLFLAKLNQLWKLYIQGSIYIERTICYCRHRKTKRREERVNWYSNWYIKKKQNRKKDIKVIKFNYQPISLLYRRHWHFFFDKWNPASVNSWNIHISLFYISISAYYRNSPFVDLIQTVSINNFYKR